MSLSHEDLGRQLNNGEISPVYLVLGPGHWARRQAVDKIRVAVVGDDPSPWAMSRGRAGECDVGVLLDGARTLPMGVDRRLVAMAGVENLKAADLELLADYAEAPSPTSCLLLDGGKLPTNNTAARRLRKAAALVECPALRPFQIPRWLADEIRGRGRKAGPGAADRIHELLGDDPEVLIQGLEKVLLYLGDEAAVIRAEDVSAVLSPVPHGTVWEFIEALEDRNQRRALSGLDALLEQGEAPEGVLRLVARSRRQMLAGLTVRHGGGGEEQVLDAMGVHPRARAAPRVRRAILQRLSGHQLHRLAADPARLLAADSQLKGGGPGDARVVLTRLVLDLLAGRGQRHSRRLA
jgi:DNA polymerase-3 subunit delta